MDFTTVRVALEAFLQYVLYMQQQKNTPDADHLEEHIQQSYLEAVEEGRFGSVLDAETGRPEALGQYASFVEIMNVLAPMYLQEVNGVIGALRERHEVSRFNVIRVTHTQVLVVATCHYLLPHSTGG